MFARLRATWLGNNRWPFAGDERMAGATDLGNGNGVVVGSPPSGDELHRTNKIIGSGVIHDDGDDAICGRGSDAGVDGISTTRSSGRSARYSCGLDQSGSHRDVATRTGRCVSPGGVRFSYGNTAFFHAFRGWPFARHDVACRRCPWESLASSHLAISTGIGAWGERTATRRSRPWHGCVDQRSSGEFGFDFSSIAASGRDRRS